MNSTVIYTWLRSIELMYFIPFFVSAITPQLTFWNIIVRIFW